MTTPQQTAVQTARMYDYEYDVHCAQCAIDADHYLGNPPRRVTIDSRGRIRDTDGFLLAIREHHHPLSASALDTGIACGSCGEYCGEQVAR